MLSQQNALSQQRAAQWLRGEGKYWVAVALLIVAYIVVMTRAQFNKYDGYGMGFDLGTYEQVIWNTSQGRPFATSNFKYTDSHLGADVILMEAIIAVPYALFPSTYTLLFIETVAVALGAVPLYLLGRRHLPHWAAVAIVFAYLIYVPLHFLNLYEFQPRAFALGLFFWLFYFLDVKNLRGYVVTILLLLTTRTDVALLVGMMGVYAWLHHKPRGFIWSSLILGFGWFVLAGFVIVPRFNTGGKLQYLEWYQWMGRTPSEIVVTMVTRPLFVLQNVITLPKLNFLAQIFGETGFLTLLRPDVLLVGLPTFALSLLSIQRIQWDIRYQYGSLLYALMFVGTIYAIAMLPHLLARWTWLNTRVASVWIVRGLTVFAVLCSLAAYVWIGSPSWSWLKRPIPASAAVANELIAMVPPEAPLAASNLFGPHVARRQGFYFFPPRNEFYTDKALELADYILVDVNTDKGDPTFEGLKTNPAWELVKAQDRYMLFRRRGSE